MSSVLSYWIAGFVGGVLALRFLVGRLKGGLPHCRFAQEVGNKATALGKASTVFVENRNAKRGIRTWMVNGSGNAGTFSLAFAGCHGLKR